MAMQHLSQLRCVICETTYPAGNRYTCDKCGVEGILDVEYDYEKIAKTLTRHARAAVHASTSMPVMAKTVVFMC